MGTLVLGLLVAATQGCATEAANQQTDNPSKPVAVARVKSSALTKKITGASAWRIYQGRTQIVVLAFGANHQPIDGIRFRYAAKNESHRWAVSFESLKHGGVMQLDAKGKVIARTMTDEDATLLIGAARVVRAWSARAPRTGAALPKNMRAFADGADCAVAGAGAVKECAPLVAECIRWGRAGASAGGARGAGAAVVVCLAWNWRRTASCAGSTADAGKTCYEAWRGQDSSEQSKNPEPQAKSQVGQDEKDPKEQQDPQASADPQSGEDDPQSEDPQASEDPSSSEAGPDASEPASDESQLESDAAAEDPESPAQDQVDDSESTSDDVDANPSDPEEQSIEDDASSDDGSSDDSSQSDDSSSSDDVATEALHRSAATTKNACSASRVLHCGTRGASAFCRCVK